MFYFNFRHHLNIWLDRRFVLRFTNDTASSTLELLMLSPTELLTHYLRGSACSASNVQQWSRFSRLVAFFICRKWNHVVIRVPTTPLDTNERSRESRRNKECVKTDYNSFNDKSVQKFFRAEWGNIRSGGVAQRNLIMCVAMCTQTMLNMLKRKLKINIIVSKCGI
jgi:hypothetical protein